jgi:hypothetical protein
VDLGFRPGGRGTGVARDQHAVDLPSDVATPLYSSDAGHSDDAFLYRGESAKSTLVVSTP